MAAIVRPGCRRYARSAYMEAPPPSAPESYRIPRTGELLAGRYRIEMVIGKGAMGAVVAATDIQESRRVAIKTILPHLAEQPEYNTRFLREARATAAIKSDHVTRVFDVGRTDDGVPFLVMELLSGTDLNEMCRGRKQMPVEEAVRYVLEACDAIAEAHALGIVHRDLKPSNLFLANGAGAQPTIKVLDFGLAKPVLGVSASETTGRDVTGTHRSIGTPQYMSPEQLRDSKRVDARTDIWSLGMILHRLLTGGYAFDDSSLAEFIVMVAVGQPTPLRESRPDAPEAIEAIILHCLQKDPADRYQNVGQLAHALAPFSPATAGIIVPRVTALLGDGAVSSRLRPLSPPNRSGEGSAEVEPTGSPAKDKTRPRLVLGLAVAVVLLVVVGLGLSRCSGEQPPAGTSLEAR